LKKNSSPKLYYKKVDKMRRFIRSLAQSGSVARCTSNSNAIFSIIEQAREKKTNMDESVHSLKGLLHRLSASASKKEVSARDKGNLTPLMIVSSEPLLMPLLEVLIVDGKADLNETVFTYAHTHTYTHVPI